MERRKFLETCVAISGTAGLRALPAWADAVPRLYDRARLVEQATDELGPVDILVNNGAITYYMPFTEFTDKRFRLMFEVQVRAPYELAQLVAPGMIERGEGWILNISSSTSTHPTQPYRDFDGLSFLYGSTKAALERFTAGLAAAEARKGMDRR